MNAAALLSANCTCWLSCEMRTLKCCLRISSRLLAISNGRHQSCRVCEPCVVAAEHAGHGRAAVLRVYFNDNAGVCSCRWRYALACIASLGCACGRLQRVRLAWNDISRPHFLAILGRRRLRATELALQELQLHSVSLTINYAQMHTSRTARSRSSSTSRMRCCSSPTRTCVEMDRGC